jgi:hypothetical protein
MDSKLADPPQANSKPPHTGNLDSKKNPIGSSAQPAAARRGGRTAQHKPGSHGKVAAALSSVLAAKGGVSQLL